MNLYSIPVDNFKRIELVIRTIHSKAEEKACVSLVNNLKLKQMSVIFSFHFCYLQIFVLYKVAHFRFPVNSGIKLYFWSRSTNLPEQDCRCEFPTDLFLLLCFLCLIPGRHQHQFWNSQVPPLMLHSSKPLIISYASKFQLTTSEA